MTAAPARCGGPQVAAMAKIYISSTYSDLEDYRRRVYEALRRLRHDVVAMEDYAAGDARPLQQCLVDVAGCDVYVGLFAWKYGNVPAEHENPEQRSITELEYREAERLGKPRLVFVLRPDAPWPPTQMDSHTGDGNRGERIRRLRDELLAERLVGLFSTPDELAGAVAAAVTLRGPDRPPELDRVLMRLRRLHAVDGEAYDREKWYLGPELDQLGDAIATAGNDPEWRAAYEHISHAILLDADRSQLEECIRQLEQLH
jgi:Domain of unknown function (DUF4062)